MKKRSTKILSLLLALVMVFSLLPMQAFAVGESRNTGVARKNLKPLPLPDCPAQTLVSDEIDGLTVTVEAPKGALPWGVEMNVTKLENLDAVQAAVDAMEGVSGTALVAADITFVSDGKEIQPQKEVTVTMQAKELQNKDDLTVVHLDAAADELNEDVEAEAVENVTSEDGIKAVTFKADSFSVYAVIGEVIIDDVAGSIDFESENYVVTVTYTEEAQIPAGTVLTVSEIPYGSEEYWELKDQALAKLNENAVFGSELGINEPRGIADAIFVDVSLEFNGQPFEPVVPLDVKITLKEGALYCPTGEEAVVVHFGADGTELIEDVDCGLAPYALPDGMHDGTLLNSFDYEQTGFSVVGLLTTDVYINFAAAQPGNPDLLNGANFAAGLLRAEGDPTINAGKTVNDTNGDGIYELALNIKATSNQSSSTSVQKSNVVMVIDVSGSMGNSDSYIYYDTYTYNAATYDQFRYFSSSSSQNTELFYGTYRTGGYNSTAHTGWYSGGQNSYGRIIYATAYSGTVYAYETRLHATQRAACAVVDALLAYNVNDDNITDIFEITVVKFANRTANTQQGYNGTEMVIRDSTSATDIKNAINGLTAGGGTNWEAAMELALTEANYYKNTDTSQMHDPEETTSVIFLTDGFPTFYGNDEGYTSGYGYYAVDERGQETDNNIALCYTNARADARAIKTAGYTLYNIFAFGNDNDYHNNHNGYQYLCGLTNYTYGSGNNDNFSTTTTEVGQYCFNAKSTDALVAAFNTIINHITNNVGFAGVNFTDGVSLGATSTSVAVNGTAKPELMRYIVKDETGKLAYEVRFTTDNKAIFTIYNADGTKTTLTDETIETVTTPVGNTSVQSKIASVTDDSGEVYDMAPATIDPDTGMVKWNLAALGILKSGYTYTLEFDVWPNQLTYDIAADLNNGIYPNIDAALAAYNVPEADRDQIKNAIVQEEDGSYAIYTNYEQSIEYYPATEVTDDQGTHWEYGTKVESDLDQPDPVPLQGSSLPMAKVWESNLAISELNELLWEGGVVGGTSLEYQITLYVWKADNEEALMTKVEEGDVSKAYITETLGWDANADNESGGKGAYVWEKDAAVAPGMMLNLEAAAALGYDTTDTTKIRHFTTDSGTVKDYYVVESGHYYYVTESGSDLHFELDSPLYHPMIVDGTLYNVFFGPNGTVTKMDPMFSVTATNFLKGGLNISKIVTDFEGNPIEGVEDEFAFIVKLWKEDEEGNISPVYTYDDQFGAKDNNGNLDPDLAISGSIGYREFGAITNEATGARVTLGRDVVIFSNSTNAATRLDKNKRGDHEPVYATLTNDNKTQIILRMPANGEIRIVNLPRDTKYTVEEIIDTSDDAVYEYVKTQSYLKYSTDNEEEEGDEGGEGEPGGTQEVLELLSENTNNLGRGTITGNKANVEKFTNKTDSYFYVYHSSDNSIEKISFTDNRVKGTYNTETGAYEYTFNIAAESKTGTLYGGYYSDYSGKSADFDAEAMTYDDKSWATDEGATPYTGANVTSSVWILSEALTENGLEMHPEMGKVYYLKEVPADKYLRPYLHYTYKIGTGGICSAWLISDVDDLNYQQTGFVIVDSNTEAEKVVSSLTVSAANGTTTIKLTPKRVFGANSSNYLSYLSVINRNAITGQDAIGLLANGDSVLQYWVTPDNLIVTGTTSRVYTGLGNIADIGFSADDNAYSVALFEASGN